MGLYQKALLSEKKALQSGEIPAAYCNVGEAQIGLKQYQQAVASYERASRTEKLGSIYTDW